ncbi:MAG: hypothetical protein QOF62_2030 [Pyrinomonadaceae bacterium]|jgi:hypothetical protein|nr:hypothetical protein [Pyrinomonadaceae bacterium]
MLFGSEIQPASYQLVLPPAGANERRVKGGEKFQVQPEYVNNHRALDDFAPNEITNALNAEPRAVATGCYGRR